MLKFSAVTFLSAALLAFGAAPASATPSSAQRFADAVRRGKVTMKQARPEIVRATSAKRGEACIAALGEDEVPERARARAQAVVVLALFEPVFAPLKPALAQIVADLDAIGTKDPALLAGRDGWHEIADYIGSLPHLDDPCGALRAWAHSGFAPDKAPPLSLDQARKVLGEDTSDEVDRKLARAAKRMRKLGVSRGDVKRFTGDTLFIGVIPDDLYGGDVTGTSKTAAP